MNSSINQKKHLEYFYEISKIPHGSGNESKIADYIVDFANKRNLFVFKDSNNNVFVRKNATNGRENDAPIMFQGHTDIVCEKTGDTEFDFEKDPIEVYEEDGFLKAKGTTLGADNGVAVAAMLTILDSDIESHPTIECLFTSEEETGLIGAGAFDYTNVLSRQMLNLDSEEEGIALAACAGGERIEVSYSFDKVPTGINKLIKVTLYGLAGGHSGADIHLERANAITLMARALLELYYKKEFQLVSIDGGSFDNAIPRECTAVISAEDVNFVKDYFKAFVAREKFQLSKEDSGLRLKTANADAQYMFTHKSTREILTLVMSLPNGVISHSKKIENAVDTSSNVGIINTGEDSVKVTNLARSSFNHCLDYYSVHFGALAKAFGACAKVTSRYPGWSFNNNSKLQEKYIKVYKNLFGEDTNPKIDSIHAGLECGVIKNALPDMDIISIGPTMFDVHTPKERLSLESFDRFMKILYEFIK